MNEATPKSLQIPEKKLNFTDADGKWVRDKSAAYTLDDLILW